jgi:hypothetical protein
MDDNDIDVDMPVPIDDVDLPLFYDGTLPEREEPALMSGFIALTALYKIASEWIVDDIRLLPINPQAKCCVTYMRLTSSKAASQLTRQPNCTKSWINWICS